MESSGVGVERVEFRLDGDDPVRKKLSSCPLAQRRVAEHEDLAAQDRGVVGVDRIRLIGWGALDHGGSLAVDPWLDPGLQPGAVRAREDRRRP